MKKFWKITAFVTAACATVAFAGCSGCSSCNKNNKNLTVTNSNWYAGTSYKGIQPSFIVGENSDYTPEVIEYKVEHVDATAVNGTYSAEYKDGKYKTEFYAMKYDWNNNPVYPQNKTETLYCYKTEFSISVQFKLKRTGETTELFNDSMTSVSYFRAAGKNLQPVYSRQEIVSASPANYQVSSLDQTYKKVNVNYDNYYSYDCGEVTTVTQENGGEKVTGKPYSFNQVKNSLFDNSSLYIAIRSMKLTTSTSARFDLYSAAQGGVSSYTVSGQDTSMNEIELKGISDEMAKNGLFTPAEGVNTVPAIAVNVNYAGGSLYGTTQTIWYAAVQNDNNNTARATMLKMTIPLSYNLGALNFTLKTIENTLWHK
ncbi:MAG: hypothetical protein K2L12_00225 [Clostridia bacterium]|nr:hypothetical protein [Clostridia bacterium]